ncbi:MAG: YgjV family protein [Clostridia bacterium]|nr:YgjV family protein [Clostridia bacterium]
MNGFTITGQIIGFIAMALLVLSFQFKDNKKLFAMQIASCFLFVFHYLFIGLGGDSAAYSGMAQNAVGLAFRVVIILGDRFKFLRSTVVMSVIAAVMAILAIFTASTDPVALLPVIGNFICLGAMWTRDPGVIRIGQLACVSPCWLAFNIFTFSIAGIMIESFNIISIVVYYIRMHFSARRARLTQVQDECEGSDDGCAEKETGSAGSDNE